MLKKIKAADLQEGMVLKGLDGVWTGVPTSRWTSRVLDKRLRFDGAAAKAPFPAVVVVFRPGQLREMGEPVPVSMLVVPKGC